MLTEILVVIWLGIDIIPFMCFIPSLKKEIIRDSNYIQRKTIECKSELKDIFLENIVQGFIMIFIIGFINIIVCTLPNDVIEAIIKWYLAVFIVAQLPMFISWVKDNNFKVRIFLIVSLYILSSILGIIAYFIDSETTELSVYHRNIINTILTIVAFVMCVILFNIKKEYNENRTKKIPVKGIRSDLIYRTPRLKMNVSNTEISIGCEKYFEEYRRCFKKIKCARGIEYVNLSGIHREAWYSKASLVMKIFFVISMLIIAFEMVCSENSRTLSACASVLAFPVIIYLFAKINKEYMYKMGIRMIYSEWGYCMRVGKNFKFVSDFYSLKYSKFHKYVHSFLDIAALCRAIAFHDRYEGNSRICMISTNLNELFSEYMDDVDTKTWMAFIPLWIAALFEFRVLGKVNPQIKKTLVNSFHEEEKIELDIFLQSFWANIEGKNLEEESLNFIKRFRTELAA